MATDSPAPRTVSTRSGTVRMRLALVLMATLVPALAAEAYVRVRYRDTDLWALTGRKFARSHTAEWAFPDAFSAYRGRPGRYRTTTDKSVNSHGFISTPELSVAKPSGTIRIAFLGESSTAGVGRALADADADTWPWRVTEMLRQRLPATKLELINAALGGYTTFESYGRLWSRVRFFSPDIVVVYHGWNEMNYFDSVDQMTSWRTLADGSWGLDPPRQLALYKPLWIDYLVRPSQLLTRLRMRLSAPPDAEVGAAKKLERSYDRRALEIFRTNLRLIRQAADLFGARLFVAKQATLIVPGLDERFRAPIRYEFHGFDHDAHVAAFEAIYQVIDQEIDPDYVIDVTPLSGIPENFHDHIHPTPAGLRGIAEIVTDALEPHIRRQTSNPGEVPSATH